MFRAALLDRYAYSLDPKALFIGTRFVMEPAPELTFMMRGVVADFLRRGRKYSTIRRGPVALVWKCCAMLSERASGASFIVDIAALFTRTSSLDRKKSDQSMWRSKWYQWAWLFFPCGKVWGG